MPCLITHYTSNLFLSWKHHCQRFGIVGWIIGRNVMSRKSPSGGTQYPCIISASAFHRFWPGSPGANPWPISSHVVLGLENDHWRIFGQAAPQTFLYKVTSSPWLPNIASSSHPPTHSHSIYLSPQRTDQERKEISLRQRRKSKTILARKFAEPRRGCG